MSSLGLDPEVPLPPIDDDSELVGKNDKLGKPDPGEGTGRRTDSTEPKVAAGAIPMSGGVAFPIPATADAAEEESDDEQ